jgi:hypothetical protein
LSTAQYQAGVCNIGGAEVKRRKQVAKIGATFFLITATYLILTSANSSSAAFALIPAMIASVGFVQSRKRFCFAFGLMGTFNFAEAGKMSKVVSKEELSADRRMALSIIAQSMGLALFTTLLLALLLAI